jgi:hypothetical protein
MRSRPTLQVGLLTYNMDVLRASQFMTIEDFIKLIVYNSAKQ